MLRALARTAAIALVLGLLSTSVSSPSRLASASTAPTRAPAPKVVLYCARGVADYPDAELTLSAAGPYELHVVYVDYRPSRGRADWALRDCLYTAGRLDKSREVIASLWVRGREPRSPRELILQCMTPALHRLPIGTPVRPNMPACPEPSH